MIYFVLPAYNEAEAISDLLKSIKELMENDEAFQGQDYHAVVVDDGSTDSTTAEIKSCEGLLPMTSLKNEKNLGLAGTMNRGFEKTLEIMKNPDEDIVVTMDGDNTHDPKQVKEMLPLLNSGVDIVLTSRFVEGAQVRGLTSDRKALSQCASWIFRTIMPIPGAKDFTCGYRAFKGSILKKAYNEYENFVSETGFTVTVDFLLKVSKFKPVIREIPLDLRYDRKVTPSKMRVARTIFRTLYLIGKRRMGVMT